MTIKFLITGRVIVAKVRSECLRLPNSGSHSGSLHEALLQTLLDAAGAKRREDVYSAFEKIYPVLGEFRKGDAPSVPGNLQLVSAPDWQQVAVDSCGAGALAPATHYGVSLPLVQIIDSFTFLAMHDGGHMPMTLQNLQPLYEGTGAALVRDTFSRLALVKRCAISLQGGSAQASQPQLTQPPAALPLGAPPLQLS